MDNQNKNLMLATVLSALVIVVWTVFFPPPAPVEPEGETTATTATSEATATPPVAAATAVPALPEAAAPAAAVETAPRISIDTPELTGSISLMGARFDDLSLKSYHVELSDDSPMVRLLSPVGGTELNANPYYVLYGWSPVAGLTPSQVPGPKTLWTAPEGAKLTPETPLTLTWDNGAGQIFTRTIAVDPEFLFTVTDTVANNGAAAVSLAPWGIIARHGIPETPRVYVLHEGLVRMTDGQLQEIKYKKIPKLDDVAGEGQAEILQATENGWTGFTDKYWMTTLIPEASRFTSVVKYVASNDLYQTETRLPATEVAAGATTSVTTRLFAGAKEWEAIAHYQNNPGWLDSLLGDEIDQGRPQITRFVDSIDWGWYYFLTKPMFRLLHWLHAVLGNMGFAIIALTVIIKLLVFPLARTSYISMAKMKEAQPMMEAIKERVKDDKQAMQREMMALYKREKINPAAGCLPVLLQIPIFFSLYKVIYVTIELYHAPWIGWIKDLSAPDPSSILNLFGLLPIATPEPGSMFFIFSLGILPILLGISMWFQQKLNPAPTDPSQAMIFAWMPWIFMFMLGSFASGLVLYWIANNTITFIQQYSIMTVHGKRPDLFGNIVASFRKKDAGTAPKK
ncbi:protein translocase subunit yidC [Rhodobacter aestuarii]|uniref:Membrane protein insertase YidC n=1 Tax=Rhodobacter aestuarii TaxID=453582 RepID=A0A1N7KEX9_9RHOB|nr:MULTISPECIES: membrane protein insertase YidC [Rhodobacter]PTV95723.1 protein translocase subunit yidC [Rhodobacter aestuarii]SIS60158.1 protein translocase subunit yidC [Rhodobacter aestuarii]SOC17654.1 protein translocase subunit yidC [Rhodobacter sp. JA431]